MIAREVVARLVEELDGRSIFSPRALIELGLPREAIDDLTKEHKSSDEAGGQVLVDDEPVDSLYGVGGIDALRWIAKAINADTRKCQAIGRGRLAELLKDAIRSTMDAQKP